MIKVYVPVFNVDVSNVFCKLMLKYWERSEIILIDNSWDGPWADRVIEKLESVSDKYVIIWMEDLLPFDRFRPWVIGQCEKWLSESNADKIELTGCYNMNGCFNSVCKYGDLTFLETDPCYSERNNLHPSIWKRKYFLSIIKKGMTPWQFERVKTSGDGAKVYGVVPVPSPFTYNFMIKNKVNLKRLNYVKCGADENIIKELAGVLSEKANSNPGR